MERSNKIKGLFFKQALLVFMAAMLLTSCGTTRHSVEIDDYVLMEGGKKVLGKEEGLTAFVFENNPRKIPFVQFVADKYEVGKYVDVSYWVNVEGHRLKVLVYDYDELQKYFDMGQFMVTKQENDVNVVGSKEHFIGLSVINNANEDCLQPNSLFHQVAINYLTKLKEEYNNL
ncbi:hypothetical protein ACLI1A_02380 [Flavobacterium sp. RHBU_3]|uniref:hypothetical protein n=1 Tax=Flavobacterium sp. RHBU_3 TaxID=3391184 RepID=UPI00398541B6